MKKIFAIMAAVVCLWGCEKNEIFTPMTVTLASEGQTMTVETTIQPQTLDILDYDGFSYIQIFNIDLSILYCVTNTLQLPSFSPRSTYFF